MQTAYDKANKKYESVCKRIDGLEKQKEKLIAIIESCKSSHEIEVTAMNKLRAIRGRIQ